MQSYGFSNMLFEQRTFSTKDVYLDVKFRASFKGCMWWGQAKLLNYLLKKPVLKVNMSLTP